MPVTKISREILSQQIEELTAEEFDKAISFYWDGCEITEEKKGREILVVGVDTIPVSAKDALKDFVNQLESNPAAIADASKLRAFMSPEEWWGSYPDDLRREYLQGAEIASIVDNEKTVTDEGYPAVRIKDAIAWLEMIFQEEWD